MMQTLQRELRLTFLNILKKYQMDDREAAADELATAAKEFHYHKQKKDDSFLQWRDITHETI